MRIDSSYPTPIHGVSTLSPRNRARGQASLQVNFRSDPVNKLTRRQSLKWLKRYVANVATNDVKFHSYIRNSKVFDIVIANSFIKGFVNGVEKPVTVEAGLSVAGFLGYSTRRELIVQTINDTTIIANPTVTVEAEDVVDNPPVTSYVNVISALNYGETLRVNVRVTDADGNDQLIQATHVVPNLGTNPPNYDFADRQRATATVAASIAQQLNTAGIIGWDCDDYGSCEPIYGSTVDLIAWSKGSVVGIQNPTGDKKITVEILAGQGTRSCVAINEINSSIEGLPLYAVADSTITIKPNPTSDRGIYYLRAEPVSELSFGEDLREVTWVESRKPTGKHKFNKQTLPVELVYNMNTDSFALSYMNFEDRKVGDDVTNKLPAFVKSKITAISYFQKRLVIVSENDVSMSRTDDIYNFFKQSVVQLLVTDPIGIASTYTEVDYIKHVIPHNRDLMFVASNGQFKIDGSTALTPQTVSMPLTTSYECQTDIAPVSMGNNVLLPITYGDSAGIQEYRREKNVDADVAHPLTHHIIGLMKGRLRNLVANGNLEMMLVTTDEAGLNKVFVYEQYSEFGEHRQRSWSVWEFHTNSNILGITFNESIIRMLVREGTNLVMKEIELYAKVTSDENEVFLDDRIEFNALTFATLPRGYVVTDNHKLICADRSNFPLTEVPFTTELDNNGDTVILFERQTSSSDCLFYLGIPYSSRYRPTRPYRYTENGIAITTDRVRVNRFTVNVANTNTLKFKIISPYVEYDDQEFNARIVGNLNNLLDVIPFHTGDIQFSYGQNADDAECELYTDNHLNLTISGLAWSGQYHETSQRM